MPGRPPRRRSRRLLAAIGARARTRSAPGEWILARGYDQTKLDVRPPSPVARSSTAPRPTIPVMLVRTCGHISICNSQALALAGIDETTPTPPGGLIEQAERPADRAAGRERAAQPVQAAIPPPSEDDLVAGIERGGRYLLSSASPAAWTPPSARRGGFGEIAAYHRAKRDGRLPVRTWLTLLGDRRPLDRAAMPRRPA